MVAPFPQHPTNLNSRLRISQRLVELEKSNLVHMKAQKIQFFNMIPNPSPIFFHVFRCSRGRGLISRGKRWIRLKAQKNTICVFFW